MSKGIDCASKLTAESAAKIKAEGYEFAGRYLVPPEKYSKALTANEAKAITDAGLKILTVYETTADRVKGGAFAGKIDAQTAYECAKAINMPTSGAIYFAVDYDAQSNDYTVISDYFKAARQYIGEYKLGIYGSCSVIEAMSPYVDCLWQCVAWSYGKKSPKLHVYQGQFNKYAGGVNVDINESADMDAAGIWDYTVKKDYEGHWAQKDIEWAIDRGILVGYSDGTVRPNEPATRAEIVTMLRRYDTLKTL